MDTMREDIVDSAVAFLQDPSVVGTPLEKRIEFLRSKNLTMPEINAALGRSQPPSPEATPLSTSQPSSSASSEAQNQPSSAPEPANRSSVPSQPSYPRNTPPYPQPLDQSFYNTRALTAPPPLPTLHQAPRRDWRDHFITATVASTLSYLAYKLFSRYVYPLLAPPTPSQLSADKAAIDADFARAFGLLERLQADTEALKRSEQHRTESLDAALARLDRVLTEVGQGTDRREREAGAMAAVVGGLGAKIEEGIEAYGRKVDGRLEDLAKDVRSLGLLMNSRLGGLVNGSRTGQSQGPPAAGPSGASAANGIPSSSATGPKSGAEAAGGGGGGGGAVGKVGTVERKAEFDAARRRAGATAGTDHNEEARDPSPSPSSSMSTTTTTTKRPSRAAIPAWQMDGSAVAEAAA